MENLNVVEILKQFTKGSKLFALTIIIIAIVTCTVGVVYINSDKYKCDEWVEASKKSTEDYIALSAKVRELLAIKDHNTPVISLMKVRPTESDTTTSEIIHLPPPSPSNSSEATILNELEEMIKIKD